MNHKNADLPAAGDSYALAVLKTIPQHLRRKFVWKFIESNRSSELGELKISPISGGVTLIYTTNRELFWDDVDSKIYISRRNSQEKVDISWRWKHNFEETIRGFCVSDLIHYRHHQFTRSKFEFEADLLRDGRKYIEIERWEHW